MKISFNDVVKNLESRGIMPKTPPSLQKTKDALARLPLTYPTDLERVIVIAGTNGKGTTAKILASLLQESGFRVGLFSSPHLISPVERIQVQGEPVTEARFCELFFRVDEVTKDLQLTHFETITAMMALEFFEAAADAQPVDYAVLEVGLGGLFDSTNAIPHLSCAITQLGWDHQEILGNSLPEIAMQKLGIVLPNAKVYYQAFPEECAAILAEHQQRLQGRWQVAPDFSYTVDGSSFPPKYTLESAWGKYRLPLLGRRACQNTNLALTVFSGLGFSPPTSFDALFQVQWPGRMQILHRTDCPAPIALSGDHNEQGMESLLEILEHCQRNHLHILIGIGEKKNARAMLRCLKTLPNVSFGVVSGFFKSRSSAELICELPEGTLGYTSFGEAYSAMRIRVQPGDLVLVTGSLYLVGEALKFFAEAHLA